MKKSYLILIVLLLMVVGYAATQMKIDIKGNTTLSENTSDFNVYLANLKLNGTEIEGINETKDGYEINVPSKGTLEYDVINDSTEYDVEATVECEEETEASEVTNFDYTGGEQTFVAPVTGVYKLETWGAQGGNSNSEYIGGYGGYSAGYVNFTTSDSLYINVGGKGETNSTPYSSIGAKGGYNGGGTSNGSTAVNHLYGAGGGATHIALKSGLLYSLENNKGDILIVSGGGGGGRWQANYEASRGKGGSGGGIVGVTGEQLGTNVTYATGGTQTSGGDIIYVSGTTIEAATTTYKLSYSKGFFGKGATTTGLSAGGGGYYGGAGTVAAGGGGSGYIGNTSLTGKSMYCYNCQESTEESTKTISTTCANSTPTENCAKSGNGYARITLTKAINSNVQLETTTIEAQDKVNKSVEVSNNGMKCSLKIKKISRTEKKVYTGPTEWTFDYTGGEQTFIAPATGTYKLETWGASGGTANAKYAIGGYGGYSTGNIKVSNGKELFINVGGKGESNNNIRTGSTSGGYNGGGIAGSCTVDVKYGAMYIASGGGATHVATNSGVLSSLENSKSNIIIVSGGGGGGFYHDNHTYNSFGNGGNAGGYIGNDGQINNTSYSKGFGGTQTNYGTESNPSVLTKYTAAGFGFGANGITSDQASCGGGAGFYGGGPGLFAGCGGGSGYIGNSLLTDKSMYCYNCQESPEESTKTISTTCISETPTENCAKSGNGYARITLIK